MKRRLTIGAKILWIAVAINALCTAVYTITAYQKQRKAFLDGVDAKLLAVATALPHMLPADIHDKVTGPDSISPTQHMEYLNLLSDYADGIEIKYLYTYMKFDDKFRVATTSATEEELEEGTETKFFTEYEQPPPEMIKAWNTGTNQCVEYRDEWGFFRSIFVPMRTAAGTRYIIGADVSLDFITSELQKVLLLNVVLGAAIFALVWVLSYSIITKIIAPVGQLAAFTHELAGADFHLPENKKKELDLVAAQHHDEVGQLAQAFSEMQVKLHEYIENLKETTAAKERIESELNIAHDIQMSLLKKIFPPFPERTEFDLCATLVPAKEVGGDLYDFCMLDADHVFFYVGDVSDKGVPAALFMAVTMTLMKRTAQTKGESADPAEILRLVNLDLSGENEKLLFVTLACFILDLKTGRLTYSNAGHNPPVILRADGTAEWLPLPKGIVLGVMPEAEFLTSAAQLGPSDTIVISTDGVTEAMNAGREVYSDARFLETVGQLKGKNPTEITQGVMDSVTEHAAGAPPSDDITIMTVVYKG